MCNKLLIAALAVFLCLGLLPLPPAVSAAGQTWLDEWAYCLPFTVNSTLIDSDLENFPVYINLESTDVFTVIGDSYAQIALADENGNQTYVEVVTWDSANAQAELWANLNISSTSDSTFYLYFDNSQLPNTAYIGLSKSAVAAQVWDNNFVMVSHLEDHSDTGHTADSTVNGNDGTKKGAAEPAAAIGQIGNGQAFDGADDKITIANTASMDVWAGNWTLEFWASRNADQGHYYYHLTGAGSGYARLTGTTNGFVESYLWDGAGVKYYAKSVTESLQHIVLTHVDATKTLQFTIDGVKQTATTHTLTLANINPTGSITLGDNQLGSNYLNGLMDEIRLSDVCRNDAWIKATYNAEIDTLLSFSSVESYAPDISSEESFAVALIFGVLAFLLAIVAIVWRRKR
jgi:hypothetical protein